MRTGVVPVPAEKPGRVPKPAKSQPWGIALDLGVRLGVSVILGLGLGLVVDNWLRTSPVFTLVGIVLGVAAAMYTIWDVAREAMRR